MVQYFVLTAATPSKETPSEIAVVAAEKPADAHARMKDHIRRKYNLPAGWEIRTATLHKASTEAEAEAFLERLIAIMKEKQETHANEGVGQESNEDPSEERA